MHLIKKLFKQCGDVSVKNKTLLKEQQAAVAQTTTAAKTPIEMAQQIKFYLNQAVGQRFDVAAERMKAVKSLNDIQSEINIIRRDNKDFPTQRTHPRLMDRLTANLNWIKKNPDKVKKALLAGQVLPPVAVQKAPEGVVPGAKISPPPPVDESKSWIDKIRENSASNLFERLVKDLSKKKVI